MLLTGDLSGRGMRALKGPNLDKEKSPSYIQHHKDDECMREIGDAMQAESSCSDTEGQKSFHHPPVH